MPGGVDEVLAPPSRASRRTRVVVGLVTAAALAGLLTARLLESGAPRPPHAVPPPSRSPSPSASVPAVLPAPVAVATVSPCPAGASCSRWRSAPPSVVAAVRDAFPAARVRSSVTELANRAGHFEPDLLARRLVVADGPGVVVVTVGKDTAAPAGSRVVAGRGGVRAVVHRPGFVVSVRVESPSPATRAALRLAEDDRLLDAQ